MKNKKKQEKIAQIKNVQAQSRNNVIVRLQKKIILVIFSIFSFCISILTEGKIQEEKTLPPFIREALLSECPARNVDSVNYPVIKGFAIIAKNSIKAIFNGAFDLTVSSKTAIPKIAQNFCDKINFLDIKVNLLETSNIVNNISVKSLINISEMHLKSGNGFLSSALFFIQQYHIKEALYVTSIIGCLFLIKPFITWNWGLGDPGQIKNKADILELEVETINKNIIKNDFKNLSVQGNKLIYDYFIIKEPRLKAIDFVNAEFFIKEMEQIQNEKYSFICDSFVEEEQKLCYNLVKAENLIQKNNYVLSFILKTGKLPVLKEDKIFNYFLDSFSQENISLIADFVINVERRDLKFIFSYITNKELKIKIENNLKIYEDLMQEVNTRNRLIYIFKLFLKDEGKCLSSLNSLNFVPTKYIDFNMGDSNDDLHNAYYAAFVRQALVNPKDRHCIGLVSNLYEGRLILTSGVELKLHESLFYNDIMQAQTLKTAHIFLYNYLLTNSTESFINFSNKLVVKSSGGFSESKNNS